jgi:hypothetical protein
VRIARWARRWRKRRPCAEAWRDYLEALNAKGEAIGKAKAAFFKQAVAEAARRRTGIWPLANGQKKEVIFTLPPHQFPIL